VPKQIAEWNTELKLWSKPNEGLFSERLELFSVTWPTSGMTQNGQAFELVMPERPINDSEFSSLPTLKARDHQAEGYEAGLRRTTPQLGTIVKGIVDEDERVIELLRSPTASQGEGGALGEAEARRRGNTVGIRDQAMDIAKAQGLKVSRSVANLPTPTVRDQYTGNLASTQQKPGSMHSVTLAQVFHKPELFPTPVASEGVKATAAQGSEEKKLTGQVWLTNIAHDLATDNGLPTPQRQLLGTPRATAANSSSKQVELGAPKARIEDQVKLFNTPTTMDAKATNNPEIAQKFLDQGRQTCLTYDVATNWGKFEPAIRRWEATIGRQAPEPTKPDGKEGNHRLSSKFTEWMMGLPEGWITDIGLKRNDELKACGNGVVPQQAELALSLLGIKEILERS
jgi:hypothetical protein